MHSIEWFVWCEKVRSSELEALISLPLAEVAALVVAI